MLLDYARSALLPRYIPISLRWIDGPSPTPYGIHIEYEGAVPRLNDWDDKIYFHVYFDFDWKPIAWSLNFLIDGVTNAEAAPAEIAHVFERFFIMPPESHNAAAWKVGMDPARRPTLELIKTLPNGARDYRSTFRSGWDNPSGLGRHSMAACYDTLPSPVAGAASCFWP
jgi:hypothetical protein